MKKLLKIVETNIMTTTFLLGLAVSAVAQENFIEYHSKLDCKLGVSLKQVGASKKRIWKGGHLTLSKSEVRDDKQTNLKNLWIYSHKNIKTRTDSGEWSEETDEKVNETNPILLSDINESFSTSFAVGLMGTASYETKKSLKNISIVNDISNEIVMNKTVKKDVVDIIASQEHKRNAENKCYREYQDQLGEGVILRPGMRRYERRYRKCIEKIDTSKKFFFNQERLNFSLSERALNLILENGDANITDLDFNTEDLNITAFQSKDLYWKNKVMNQYPSSYIASVNKYYSGVKSINSVDQKLTIGLDLRCYESLGAKRYRFD